MVGEAGAVLEEARGRYRTMHQCEKSYQYRVDVDKEEKVNSRGRMYGSRREKCHKGNG